MTAGTSTPSAWAAQAVAFKLGTGHDLQAELEATEPRVRGLVLLAAGVSLALFSLPLIVTHVHRTNGEESMLYDWLRRKGQPIPVSPHQADPSRAVDVRTSHAPDPRTYGRTLAAELNSLVVYGPTASKFCCALFEEPPLVTASHLHLQVPPVVVHPVPARLIA